MANARLAVAAITLDFGNTLVRVDRPGLRAVVEDTAATIGIAEVGRDRAAFLVAWAEERERQFREEVPEFREVDIDQRAIRVLARLRGMPVPPPESRWDDAAAATHVREGEVGQIVDAYSRAFIRRMHPVTDAEQTLRRLHERGFVLGILSNWPLAITVERFAEAQGWLSYLRAVVVSQRIGTIKPHPAIFAAAAAELGVGPERVGDILHVGDDWAADVVGARRAGWRAAYLRGRQEDTPLPTSEPGDGSVADADAEPDVTIDELSELDGLVDLAGSAEAPPIRTS